MKYKIRFHGGQGEPLLLFLTARAGLQPVCRVAKLSFTPLDIFASQHTDLEIGASERALQLN
jgi:hypothetical protein